MEKHVLVLVAISCPFCARMPLQSAGHVQHYMCHASNTFVNVLCVFLYLPLLEKLFMSQTQQQYDDIGDGVPTQGTPNSIYLGETL